MMHGRKNIKMSWVIYYYYYYYYYYIAGLGIAQSV